MRTTIWSALWWLRSQDTFEPEFVTSPGSSPRAAPAMRPAIASAAPINTNVRIDFIDLPTTKRDSVPGIVRRTHIL